METAIDIGSAGSPKSYHTADLSSNVSRVLLFARKPTLCKGLSYQDYACPCNFPPSAGLFLGRLSMTVVVNVLEWRQSAPSLTNAQLPNFPIFPEDPKYIPSLTPEESFSHSHFYRTL